VNNVLDFGVFVNEFDFQIIANEIKVNNLTNNKIRGKIEK
jgi:hypothetical protein